MRRIILPTIIVFFFLSGGANIASANTLNLSYDPSYGTQPFSYYCQPYVRSFEADKHYMPVAANQSCVFSVPNTIGGIRDIALYKGTPGNAVLISSDQINNNSAPTLVQENNTNFGSPVQDQDYFAVIYDDSIGAALYAHFTGGGLLPAGAIQNQNYYVLPWKWGSKPTSEFEPVIIVPGILGSWQKNNDWVIDPILHIYDNLIDTFLANGYVKDKTLFTFGYDWEEPNEVSAHLLANKIKEVKQICGCSRVDLVTHSMGGLVASYYIENSEYQNDVDQLVLIAVPLSGAPYAYKTWEAGVLEFGDPKRNFVMQTKFLLEARKNGYSNIFNYIHGRPIESIQELLPNFNYLTDQNFVSFIYPNGYPINGFLDDLDKNFWEITQKVRVDTILADNQLNNTELMYAVKPSTNPSLWVDGEPTITTFDSGDGTVPRLSIEDIVTPDKEFDGVDHTGVVATSSAYVFKVFNNREVISVINKDYNAVTSFLFITLFSPIDMQVIAPDGKRLGKDFDTSSEIDEIPGTFYSGFDTDNEYAIIPNPEPGEYKVETVGTGNGGEYKIVTDYVTAASTTEAGLTGSTTPGEVIDHTLSLSAAKDDIVLTKDVLPPPATTFTPESCITDTAAAYQAGQLSQSAYEGITLDCKTLGILLRARDNIFAAPLTQHAVQNPLLTITFSGIRLTLDDIDLLANDQHNTKDGVQLISTYLTWFRNHDLHQ